MKLKITALASLIVVSGMVTAQETQVVKIGHVAPVYGAQAN